MNADADPWSGGSADLDVPTSSPRGSRRVLFGCMIAAGGSFGLLVLGLIVLGALSDSGHFPPTHVTTGEDTNQRHLASAREIGALTDEEEVLLFYSWGVFDAAEGGTALTDQGVAIWFEDQTLDGGYEIDRIPYAAIQGAAIEERGSLLADTSIEIETPLTYYFTDVSVENGGDDLFLERLLEEWEQRGGHRPRAVPDWFSVELAPYFPALIEGEPSSAQLAALREFGALTEDEEVLMHISRSSDNEVTWGCAITDRGISAWDVDLTDEYGDPAPRKDCVPYAAIMGVTNDTRASLFDLTAVEIDTRDAIYYAWVPRLYDADKRFRDRARLEWRSRGGLRPHAIPDWFKSGDGGR